MFNCDFVYLKSEKIMHLTEMFKYTGIEGKRGGYILGRREGVDI